MCLLVANKINCFLAIHFVLLDYYCLLGRLVIQLFLLQEVLINISTYPHLKRFEGIADICVAAILTSKPAFLDYVKCVSVNLWICKPTQSVIYACETDPLNNLMKWKEIKLLYTKQRTSVSQTISINLWICKPMQSLIYACETDALNNLMKWPTIQLLYTKKVSVSQITCISSGISCRYYF